VRQHGVSLTPGLAGSIEAKDETGRLVKVPASAADKSGYYSATLTLPSPGKWTLTVDSGFWGSRSVQVPMKVIAPGDAPSTLAAVDRGAQLFAAKGCATCHTHVAIAASPGFGPNLSAPRLAPEFLKAFLADPSIKPVSTPTLRMPDLELNDREIASLVAFLTTPNAGTASVASR
jgi:hypothetical protein